MDKPNYKKVYSSEQLQRNKLKDAQKFLLPKKLANIPQIGKVTVPNLAIIGQGCQHFFLQILQILKVTVLNYCTR